MVKDDAERYQWFQFQRSIFAEPGSGSRVIKGKAYARILAKVCPHCDSVFYTYQVLGEERHANRQDPLPVPGSPLQTRETCGNPKCWDDELGVKYRRDQFALAAARKARGVDSTASAQPQRLVRNGQNQGLKRLKELNP